MLTTLRQIVEGVTQAPSLHDAMNVLVRQTRSAMQVDCCTVYFAEPQRRRYRLVASGVPVATARLTLGIPTFTSRTPIFR